MRWLGRNCFIYDHLLVVSGVGIKRRPTKSPVTIGGDVQRKTKETICLKSSPRIQHGHPFFISEGKWGMHALGTVCHCYSGLSAVKLRRFHFEIWNKILKTNKNMSWYTWITVSKDKKVPHSDWDHPFPLSTAPTSL